MGLTSKDEYATRDHFISRYLQLHLIHNLEDNIIRNATQFFYVNKSIGTETRG